MVHERGHDPDVATTPPREQPAPRVPRRDLLSELDRMDEAVRIQGIEENLTMFHPDVHPKQFRGMADLSDPVADSEGNVVDMMGDTPNLDDAIAPEDRSKDEVISDGDLLDVDL